MSITLGTAPEQLTVILTKDADFFTTLRNADGPWSGTAQIQLRLGSTIWPFTITGADAVLSVESTAVNTIIASKQRTAKLFYKNGTTDVCWGVGMVEARG